MNTQSHRRGYIEKRLPCGHYREWPEEYGLDFEAPFDCGICRTNQTEGELMLERLKKYARAAVAAATSAEAVKREKSLAAFLLVRALLAAGATDGTVRLVQQILGALS